MLFFNNDLNVSSEFKFVKHEVKTVRVNLAAPFSWLIAHHLLGILLTQYKKKDLC